MIDWKFKFRILKFCLDLIVLYEEIVDVHARMGCIWFVVLGISSGDSDRVLKWFEVLKTMDKQNVE